MAIDLPPSDESRRQRVAYGSLMAAVAAAASFASILTLVALQRADTNAQGAMIAFCIALPLLAGHRFVTADPVGSYRISCLHSILTILGLFAFLLGVALLIATISIPAAVVFVVLSFAMAIITMGAEKRAGPKN